MRGVTFPGGRRVELLDFPEPTPGPGEVVMEVRASGMCGSDLKYYRGAPATAASLGLPGANEPVIAGHEPCGEVVAVGAGVEGTWRIGDRVMQHHYLGCQRCAQCSAGWMQLCENGMKALYGVSAHGAHARYMKCPARTLVAMPDGLSFDAGAALACGTGTAWGALQRLGLQAHHTIAVFGQGPVGLSATLLAASLGARVIAVDMQSSRLELASALGAWQTFTVTGDTDPAEAVRTLTGGRGADLALDTSAASAAQSAAVRCVATWGRACFVGEGGQVTLDVSRDLLRRQVTLMGSWTFSMAALAECARHVVQREVAVDKVFTHRWRLEEAEEAYRIFDRQSGGKAVFHPA